MPAWSSASVFWQHPFWQLASIPLVAILAGWLAYRLAASIAWRSAPVKAGRRAEVFAERALLRLVSLAEIFERLEPGLIAGQVLKVFAPRLRRITDEILLDQDAALWRATPDLVKQRVYANLEASLPRRVEALVREANRRIGELVDYRHLAVSRLTRDPALLERISASLRPFGPLVPHGLFEERRKEAAAAWCRIAATEIVSMRAIVQEMLEGPKKENTAALLRRHLEPLVDDAFGSLKTGVEMALGRGKINELREAIGRRAEAIAAHPFADWQFNHERAERVELLLRERLAAMPPEERRHRLRPVFPAAGLRPVLAGVLLGLIAGAVQAFLVCGS